MSEFVEQFHITLDPKRADDWRACLFERQRDNYTVKGLPHLGLVHPRITDGVHTWVTTRDKAFKVHDSNLTRAPRSKDPPAFLVKEDDKTKKKRIKKATVEVLRAFGMSDDEIGQAVKAGVA